jgi:hypothetical protein
MIILGTATAMLVLSGAIADSRATRLIVTACVMLALATLLFRISVDVFAATRDDQQQNSGSP